MRLFKAYQTYYPRPRYGLKLVFSLVWFGCETSSVWILIIDNSLTFVKNFLFFKCRIFCHNIGKDINFIFNDPFYFCLEFSFFSNRFSQWWHWFVFSSLSILSCFFGFFHLLNFLLQNWHTYWILVFVRFSYLFEKTNQMNLCSFTINIKVCKFMLLQTW